MISSCDYEQLLARRRTDCPAGLIRHPGDGANLAKLAAHLGPGIPRIGGQIQVTVQTVGDDDVGVRLICSEPVNRGIWLDRQLACFPASAAVPRSLDCAALARDEVAIAHEDRVRISGLERDSAAIGDRVPFCEPGESMQRPRLALVKAAPDSVRRRDQQLGLESCRERHTMYVAVEFLVADL